MPEPLTEWSHLPVLKRTSNTHSVTRNTHTDMWTCDPGNARARLCISTFWQIKNMKFKVKEIVHRICSTYSVWFKVCMDHLTATEYLETLQLTVSCSFTSSGVGNGWATSNIGHTQIIQKSQQSHIFSFLHRTPCHGYFALCFKLQIKTSTQYIHLEPKPNLWRKSD